MQERAPGAGAHAQAGRGRRGGTARAGRQTGAAGEAPGTPRPLREVAPAATARLSTGIGELDRVLGGGLVPGSLVLLGGSPGIGKSTLTNMALGNLARAGHDTLYVSGEESAEQVRLRAERLVLDSADPVPGRHALDVPILAETDLDAVLDTLAAYAPKVCVIDSVQTLRAGDRPGSTPGAMGQVREVTGRIMELAKERGIAVVLVGHVTKDGSLAGPRVLEHLVRLRAAVRGRARASVSRAAFAEESLRLDQRGGPVRDAPGRAGGGARRLRAIRRRGDARARERRAGGDGGLPAAARGGAGARGAVRVEQPRRVVSGLDRNRLALVLAILGRHGGVALGGSDVFVNVVGGVRVEEPGCDLAVALAVASAARGVALRGTPRACFGELGLTGELRWVGHPERRLAEAAKHGLSATIAPSESGAGAFEVGTLREALAGALGENPGSGRSPCSRPDSASRSLME